MQIPESRIESLVVRCLLAGASGYRAEVERICAAEPEVEVGLRRHISRLEQLGLVGEKRTTSGARWLPDEIGGYRLSGLLGRGGMGVVFRGSKSDGSEVAIKLVRPDLLADERARERFRREALLASRLSHPGICPVLEVGIDDSFPYLVMPLLHGLTFGAWLRERRPDRAALLAVLESFARALDAAHAAGLVHRDVNPSNLFVTEDGRAIVLDFGLAHDTTGLVESLTLSDEMLGTLPYMAPEQIRASTIDCRTDVYALGVVTYEALSGRLPFMTRLRGDLTRLILEGGAPRLSKLSPAVPRPLERIVQTAMDPEPSLRYATALDFAEDLARMRSGGQVMARGVGPVLRTRRWAHHHPVATTAMLLLGLLLGVTTWFAAQQARTVRILRASEQALASRNLERADPMRAIHKALEAYDGDPSPVTAGQLNRLLHQVSMLGTISVLPGPVRRLATFRIDERCDRVAVASESGVSLLLVDRRDGTLHREQELRVPTGVLLRCVRFSPDGRLLAFGGTGKMAFSAAVGAAEVRALSGSSGEVYDVEIDDEGNVFGADVNGRLLYWPAGTDPLEARALRDLKEPSVHPGHEQRLRGLRAGPGGDLLLWNFHYAMRVGRDGQEVWVAPPAGKGEAVPTVVIDEPRRRVLICQLGTIRLLDWENGQVLWAPVPSSPVVDCAVAADGTIATLHSDGSVRFWNGGAEAFAYYRDPHDHIGAVLSAPGVDGFLVVGRGGSQTRLDRLGRPEWSMAGGDIERWGLPGPYLWTSDGSILVAGGGPGSVRTWDFAGSRVASQARFVDSPPLGISVHPDRRRLIIYTADRRAWLWAPGSPRSLLGDVPLELMARSATLPGERVVIGGRDGLKASVAIFDPESAEFRVPFQHEGAFGIVGVAWVPGNRLLLGAGDNRWQNSRLQLFETARETLPFRKARIRNWEVPEANGRLTCMDASRDGRRVAFGCVAGGVHVWELSEGAMDARPLKSTLTAGRVWSIDISGDGRLVVAGIQDGSVLAWKVDEGGAMPLVPPRGRPARCCLLDNDHLVIEFAFDGLVQLWDTSTRTATVVFQVAAGDGAVVRDAVLFPKDPAVADAGYRDLSAWYLATVSSDGWVRLWDLDVAAVAREARSRLEALEPR